MAEETTNTNEEQTAEKEQDMIKCPCCGEMTLKKPLDIKSAILDEYMASVITGVSFAHTYTIHDTIDVTVEVPTKREAHAVYTACKTLDRMQAMLPPEDIEKAQKLKAAITMLQIYSDIISITTKKDGKIIKSYTPAEAMKQMLAAIHDSAGNIDLIIETYQEIDIPDVLSTLPDTMLRYIVDTHNSVYNILMENGFNANFWKGIELV